MDLTSSLTIIAGCIILLIVPGYAITEILFRKWELGFMERLAASLAFGILATPAIMLVLNKTIRMRITAYNTSMVVLVILAYTLFYVAYLKRRYRADKANQSGS
jgi:uncharacterized membrane protein